MKKNKKVKVVKEFTKKDFNKFLDSFKKEPGEYTEDEQYQIGVKYKSLPTSDKRWDDLVKVLGIDKDGECFRIWIKGRQYADGTITKNEHMLSGKTIDDLTYPEFESKVEEQKRELYKQQTKTRDVYNSYRLALRHDARDENFRDMLIKAVKKLPALPSIKPAAAVSNKKPVEAVMLLSDLHLGVCLDTFYNKYNVEIAKARVQKYVNDTIAYCKKYKVQRLNVINGGDLIAGNIHVTGRLEQEIDVTEQVMFASEILADALNQLTSAAPEVVYRSCTDNHSRATQNFRENLEQENLSRVIDHYVKARLDKTNIVFANDNLDYELSKFTLLNGKKVMAAHGHRDNYNMVIQSYLGASKEYIDYIFLSHFHSAKAKSFQGIKVIINGSIIGTDQYAYSKRLFGEPEQVLMIFDGDNVIMSYINLDIRG